MSQNESAAFLAIWAHDLADSLKGDGPEPDPAVLREAVARVEAVLCDTFCHRAEGTDPCREHRVMARTAVYSIDDLLRP